MALFFVFSMLLGAALQLSNMYGDAYLSSFPKDSIVEKYSTIIYSISQVSETVFILSIPFFLRRFGMKKVMLFALIAWVLRYGFFSIGGTDYGSIFIVLSCIVYGMAFDFFLISNFNLSCVSKIFSDICFESDLIAFGFVKIISLSVNSFFIFNNLTSCSMSNSFSRY